MLAGAVLLSACSQDQPQQESTAATVAAVSPAAPADSTPTAAAAPSRAAPTPAASAKTVYQLLQGKWQSTQDEKAVIEFKDRRYVDYYENEQLGSKPFVLDKACSGEAAAGHPGNDERYLSVPEDDMCWHIAMVDEQSLELEYIARGNVLVYRKIK